MDEGNCGTGLSLRPVAVSVPVLIEAGNVGTAPAVPTTTSAAVVMLTESFAGEPSSARSGAVMGRGTVAAGAGACIAGGSILGIGIGLVVGGAARGAAGAAGALREGGAAGTRGGVRETGALRSVAARFSSGAAISRPCPLRLAAIAIVKRKLRRMT